MYLVVSDCVVNVVLFRCVNDKEQKFVYYVSKAIVDIETRYSNMEQIALALKSATWKLRPYFQAHQVTILTNQPFWNILHKPDLFEDWWGEPLNLVSMELSINLSW